MPILTKQALEESENRLHAIIETAVEGIITIDAHGLIESFNSAASRLLGYSPEEVIGKNVKMLMPEPYKSQHDSYLDNYHRTGIAKIIGIGRQVVAKKKNGEIFPIFLSISEVQLHNRKIYTGLIRDISAEKEAEEKLKQYAAEVENLNRYLETRVDERTLELENAMKALNKSTAELKKSLEEEMELNDMKSKFVTVASHEFRTPLTTILSSAALISKYTQAGDEEKRLKHVNRIKSSVENLTGILDDFLSLSKMEEGIVQADNILFNLHELCGEIRDEMNGVLKTGQKIIYEYTGEQVEVTLDKKILRNVIINLLSNAIKFSPENSIIDFKTSVSSSIEVTIKDQGIGIPATEQKHLFDRFFRASNAANIQGTGLGLHIVKRYVEMMGGEICLTSKAGKGTTFAVKLNTGIAR